MNIADIKYLADCQECMSIPGNERVKECKDCKYRFMEEVSKEIPAPADVVIDGVEYWCGCDCDKVELESAKVLHKLADFLEQNERLAKLLEITLSKKEKSVVDKILLSSRTTELDMRRNIAKIFEEE